ncbi:unnamed protein product [Nippostrongylus brasiliensis]|uniref:SERPIN domain-containing protein n=1 Tax=Nippostrongylus brasiliensis TaxID=27835 RepID=A0A158R013_NIPBR|nr:unnamed protein product [Nippostrongylus brasiliensis]
MLLHGALDESVVVSPISVIFALAMLEAGAKGKTKSQIANVIAKESFDADLQNHYSNLSSQIQQARNDVKAYIANGFFLKWLVPFEKESTTNDTFYSSATNSRQADFMNAYSKHEMYAEDEDVQMLSLSYEDPSFAFNIILPKSSGGADFSGITKSPPLRISDAVHRAIIEVDEEGTTASAATGFVAAGSAFTLDEPKKFEADHPFWFILTKDNNPLFMGQFNFYSNLSSQVRHAKNGIRADIANGFHQSRHSERVLLKVGPFPVFLPKIPKKNSEVFSKQYTIDKNYENTIAKKYSARVQSLDFTNTKAAAKLNVWYKIPKMKLDTDFKLKEALIATGLSEMPTDKADFSGITNSPPLKISDAAHRAIIEVDEDGTTAVAATVLVAVGSQMPVDHPKIFYADYPFWFVLTKDNNSLFMGQFFTAKAMNRRSFGRFLLFLRWRCWKTAPKARQNHKSRMLLPTKTCNVCGGPRLESALTAIRRHIVRLQYYSPKDQYKIPKMKIETDLKLKEALIAMGVSEMFSGGADFCGVTRSPPLRISDAVHRAIIEVDEEGTTASAANGFIATAGSAFTLDEPKKFEADHPSPFILTKEKKFEADHPFWMFPEVETDFGLKMLQHADTNQSVVVSPLSVIFALAMVEYGAKGKTKSQIDELIAKSASNDEIHSYYSNLSSEIRAASKVKTSIANGFFLNNQYSVEKEYEQGILEKYAAKVQALDFRKAKEAAKIVDDFISKATESKIKDMVTEDTVKDAFSLIVNAIYFKADWEHKFYKSSTSNKTFHSSEGNGREIEFMNEYDETRLYTEDDDVQVLSLRYEDTSYAFNIFLPKTRFGLADYRKKLDGAKVQQLLANLKHTYISYSIPKMNIETDFPLKDALICFGITDVFDANADLSRIASEPPLRISDASHRAIIEVDEEGTTAAAATVFKIVPLMARMEVPKQFTADHPFLFVLTKDSNPLFMGQFLALISFGITDVFGAKADSSGITSKAPLRTSDASHRMTIETDFPLKDALVSIGIIEVFGGNSDLTGIASKPPLRISEASHRAVIEVDEEGTTAAATTLFKIVPESARLDEPKQFIADHPFFFYSLPKMKIEMEFGLKEALIGMGMPEAFSDRADLTGIAKSPPLHISDAAHKAVIEVDEDGTTAAAATLFKITPKSGKLRQPLRFIADHPFMFILTKDENPLFMALHSVIVNAIYFRAEWLVKFDKGCNSKEPFYSSEGNQREVRFSVPSLLVFIDPRVFFLRKLKVEFMNEREEFRMYTEDDEVQVLSLQYKDSSYAFNIILPKARFGLADYKSKLTAKKIQELLHSSTESYMTYSIPKMKIETDFKLKEALISMGVSDMFSDGADLTGISKAPPLKVSDASHRAIIENVSGIRNGFWPELDTTCTGQHVGGRFASFGDLRLGNASVRSLDFDHADEAARIECCRKAHRLVTCYPEDLLLQIIDGFVSNSTEGKIEGMVTADSLQGIDSLLVNAIHFRADWLMKFDPVSNKIRTFYSSEGNKRKLSNLQGTIVSERYRYSQIEFMTLEEEWLMYAEDDLVEVIALEYQDPTYAFNIILPKARFGLANCRSKLTGKRIQELLGNMTETYFNCSIPKMKIKTDFKLKEALVCIGISDMFSETADLTGIGKKPPLLVSAASHKAIIEVDEDGTTAAAVTLNKMIPLSALFIKPKVFIADHPFMFVLTKDKSPMFPMMETEFGLKTLQITPINSTVVFSPVSVLLALAMVQAGAKGSTKSEIDKVIYGETSNDAEIEKHYADLSRRILNTTAEVECRLANGLFIDKTYVVNEQYEQSVSQSYGATVKSLNFQQANESVQKMTFHGVEGKDRKIDFLIDRAVRRPYTEDEDAQVLALPYKDLSSQLLLIPKFDIESNLDLKGILISMGISKVFSTTADLSGITSTAPLRVNKATHKAMIEVNEHGTKASAVTTLKLPRRSGRVMFHQKEFLADHPFLMSLSVETDFGLGMMRYAPANESLVVSPISVIFALAMIHPGVGGRCRKQIDDVIFKGVPDGEKETVYSNLYKDIQQHSDNGSSCEIANASRRFLGINPPTNIVTDAHFLLVNAIHFTAEWLSKFNTKSSVEMTFYSSENNKRQVTFMRAARVSRPYADDDDVQVAIPKMKIETDFALKEALKSMGIEDIFTDTANFSGMIEGDPATHVSNALHKAVIEVDESGTSAAAATSVRAGYKSLIKAVSFVADHPFMFILTKDRNPIFMGQYV